MQAYLLILTNKETKEEKHIYLFYWLEVLSLLPKIPPTLWHIQLSEVSHVYNIDTFTKSTDNLIPDEYWANLSVSLDKLLDTNNDDNLFGNN